MIVVSLLFAAAGAFAGNEGPFGAPVPPRVQLIAEHRTYGGMMPMPEPGHRRSREHGVRVFSDGSVHAFTEFEDELIATISSDAFTRFKNSIAAIEEAELTDSRPGAPRCTDVPSTETRVLNHSGAWTAIYRRASCHEYQLLSSEAESVERLLEGFEELAK